MSARSSRRPSTTSAGESSPASQRPSNEISVGNKTTGSARLTSASPSVAHRRNRAALRDYYNIRPAEKDTSQEQHANSLSVPGTGDGEPVSVASSPTANTELENPDFNPESYISQLLATSSLSTILRAENSLLNDIRTLDGERKALVYDNYSKLIKAVETICKMRANIEEKGGPMVMAKTLAPSVGFVAETATSLIREQGESGQASGGKEEEEEEETNPEDKSVEKETVKWALDTPRRLKELLSSGRRSEAEGDWGEIKALLAKWEGVSGVDELKEQCEEIMRPEG